MPERSEPELVTGSRRGDLWLCLAIACFVLATSYRLRVYFRVVVAEVDGARIVADGTREAVPAPEQCSRLWLATQRPRVFFEALEDCLRRASLPLAVGSATRLEWTVRYSENSTRLDERRVVTFTTGGAQR